MTKKSRNNEIHELLEGAKIHLNEIKKFKLNEIDAKLKTLKEKDQLSKILDQLQTEFNKLEYDILEDENKRQALDLNEKEDDEFNNIMEERREFLSRLEVIIENAKNKL